METKSNNHPKYNKSRVFKTAWQIWRKDNTISWSNCLKQAWSIEKNGIAIPTAARYVMISAKLVSSGSGDTQIRVRSGVGGDGREYEVCHTTQNANQDSDVSFFMFPLKNNGDGTASFDFTNHSLGAAGTATVTALGFYV